MHPFAGSIQAATSIGIDLYRINSGCNIDRHRSASIGIDRHRSASIGIDQHPDLYRISTGSLPDLYRQHSL